jgi:hypothetical protein
VLAGVERKKSYLAFDLPHSDDCFVMAFPAKTTEAFLEGIMRACGVPTRILYDNRRPVNHHVNKDALVSARSCNDLHHNDSLNGLRP